MGILDIFKKKKPVEERGSLAVLPSELPEGKQDIPVNVVQEQTPMESVQSINRPKYIPTSGGGGGVSPSPPPVTDKSKVTLSQKVSEYAQQVKEAKQQAGIYGKKDIGYARQLGILRQQTRQQKEMEDYAKATEQIQFKQPSGVVTKAPTYKDYMKDRTKILGTLSYLSEKTQGKLAQLEYKYTPKSQSLAQTEKVSQTLQVAPYLIPYVGETLLVAGGTEQIATKTGRAEIKEFGKVVKEKTGVPEVIGSMAGYTLAVGGIVLGAYSGVKRTESLLGYPKTQVKYTSKEIIKTDDIIKSKTTGTITEKGLLSQKTSLFGSESYTKVKPIDDVNFYFAGGTKGVTRQIKGYKLPSGKPVYKKPEPFGSVYYGEGKYYPKTLEIPIRKGLTLTKEAEGMGYYGALKLLTKRTEPKTYLSVGTATNLNKVSYAKSIFRGVETKIGGGYKVLKGKGESFGVSKVIPEEDISLMITGKGVKQKTLPTKTIQAQQEEQILQQLSMDRKTIQPKPLKIESQQVKTIVKQDISIIPKQTIIQKTETIQKQTPFQVNIIQQTQQTQQKALQRPNLISKTEIIQPTKERLKVGLSSIQIQKQGQQQRYALRQFTPVKTLTSKRIIVPPPIIKLPKSNITQNQLRKPKVSSPIFKTEVKRYGEWFGLTKSPTLKKAVGKGIRFTRQTLGASFRIRKNNKLIPLEESIFYRESKKNPLVLVQKRKYRLSSFGEKGEILRARR